MTFSEITDLRFFATQHCTVRSSVQAEITCSPILTPDLLTFGFGWPDVDRRWSDTFLPTRAFDTHLIGMPARLEVRSEVETHNRDVEELDQISERKKTMLSPMYENRSNTLITNRLCPCQSFG